MRLAMRTSSAHFHSLHPLFCFSCDEVTLSAGVDFTGLVLQVTGKNLKVTASDITSLPVDTYISVLNYNNGGDKSDLSSTANVELESSS